MSSYIEGQIHQLANRLEKEGFTSNHVTKLGQFNNLAGIRSILDGKSVISPIGDGSLCWIKINETTIAVNLDAPSSMDLNVYRSLDGINIDYHFGEGWAIIQKFDYGLCINGHKIDLYFAKSQRGRGAYCPLGYRIQSELSDKLILNGNVLDALYNNQHLIPDDFKKKDDEGDEPWVFFWGTTYCDRNKSLYVRALHFDGIEWRRELRWLGFEWNKRSPAAILIN